MPTFLTDFLASIGTFLSPIVIFSWTVGIFGLISIVGGVWLVYDTHSHHPQYEYQPLDPAWKERIQALVDTNRRSVSLADGKPSALASPSGVWVDVSGAVQRPGVYQVNQNSRIQEVILAAGGFSKTANLEYVHQALNLAEHVQDARKLYIPFAGETYQALEKSQVSGSSKEESHAELSIKDGSLSPEEVVEFLNQATEAELMEVKNVGEVRAQAVMAARPFQDFSDVQARSKLPSSILDSLQKGGN